MKKFLVICLALAMLLVAACGNTGDKESSGEKKKVTVTTSFLYDMVETLAGDDVDLNLIIP